jgi:hypothetical protein
MSSVATCLYGIHGNSLDKNSAYFEKLKDMMAKNV